MFRRRRPLLRGAVVGGAAYEIGKHRAEKKAEYEAEAAEQEQAPVDEPKAISGDQIEELRKLAQLEEEGILTEEEFAAQKAKLLGG